MLDSLECLTVIQLARQVHCTRIPSRRLRGSDLAGEPCLDQLTGRHVQAFQLSRIALSPHQLADIDIRPCQLLLGPYAPDIYK